MRTGIETVVHPERTGHLAVVDHRDGWTDISSFTGIVTDTYWLDVPRFGQREALTRE